MKRFLISALFIGSVSANMWAVAKQSPPPAMTPETALETDMRGATSDYKNGHYVRAMERCRFILNSDGGNLRAHYLLGNIFWRLGRLEPANAEFEFCTHHGPNTNVAKFARQAMQKLKIAAAQQPLLPPLQPGNPAGMGPAGQGLNGQGMAPGTNQGPIGGAQANNINGPGGQAIPAKVDFEVAEKKDNIMEKADTAITDKRVTLQASIARLNAQADAEVDLVPKYIWVGKMRVANPDYASQVQVIRDDYAFKIQILQTDEDNEERKINAFYKALSDSYDLAKPHLQSQTDDGRVGHKLVDPDPSMYVQNFASRKVPAKAQGQIAGSGVQLQTKAQKLPTAPAKSP